MKQPIWHRTANILFILTIAVFFSFFIYMSTMETVSVYQAEQPHSYRILTDTQLELVSDASAPAGLQKVYRWTLDPQPLRENYLCFNIPHHHVQVYFDDVLVYSLTGAESNRIGRNVGRNWCIIHAGLEHAGQAVTVILTPLLEAAISKEPEFLFGSRYAIAFELLQNELPLMIFSTLCCLLGIFLVAVSLYFRCFAKIATNGIVYLGLFSVFLGLWKLTDLQFAPLLMPAHSMALSYVSIGSLFLTGPCLLLYFSALFTEKEQHFLLVASWAASAVCLVVLAMQLLGIAEIRQNLLICHILLIAAIASIPVASVWNRIRHKNFGLRRSWRLLLLLFMGIVLDLRLYYRNNGNGTLSFTILGFIIYTLIVFLGTVQDATRKAYMDSRTGLANRARWNELMHDDIPLPEPYGILVIDLNGLKKANDTLGHEAGDQMIFQLSSILRNTLPRASVICRWGGDEFAVLLSGVNRAQLEQQIEGLFAAGGKYNDDHPELPIYFSVGAALSSEHPGISRTELFRLADEEMYRNKQRWYAVR